MSVMYDIAYAVGVVASSPVWVCRLAATGKWRTDWAARFGRVEPLGRGAAKTLLIHAVSVGEVNAIRLLVQRLAERAPNLRLVISTTTDTGQARAKSLFEPRHRVVRFPLDFTFSVRRFLDAVRPDAAALVENEVWPNFMAECERRSIPVCLVNGRLSERSFKRYRMIAPIARRMYGKLTVAAVQTQAYADRLAQFGLPANRIHILDTMKWDTANIADRVDGADELGRAMGIDRSRPLIVAGSTGPGEEKLLIDMCPPNAQLLLVPRKPERFDEVAALALGIVRRTQHPDGSVRPLDRQRLFLLDTMGELRKAYSLADVAIVGRSFLGLFGSDMIEPIALGKPTLIGPHYGDFADTVEALLAGEGIIVTSEPGRVAAELLANRADAEALAQRGRAVIRERQGSTDRHVQLLLDLLEQGAVNPPLTDR